MAVSDAWKRLANDAIAETAPIASGEKAGASEPSLCVVRLSAEFILFQACLELKKFPLNFELQSRRVCKVHGFRT